MLKITLASEPARLKDGDSVPVLLRLLASGFGLAIGVLLSEARSAQARAGARAHPDHRALTTLDRLDQVELPTLLRAMTENA